MYPGIIPGSRASLAIDMLAIATVLTALLLLLSIYVVRVRRNFKQHRHLQIFTSVLLLVALFFFEIQVRIYGWREQAQGSSFFVWLSPLLTVHITLAVSAAITWVVTLALALRRFPSPPMPTTYSRSHKKMALLTVVLMYLTVSSGLLFYTMAFVF